jgi:hypothetical protein
MGFLALTLALSLPAADPFPYAEAEAELSVEIREAELKAHVYRLASPEFLGRKGPGAARAARHIADAFARLKLAPAFEDSYFQRIPWLLGEQGKDTFIGSNVGCVLPGTDPKLKDEWILLSAHFDHLGKQGDKLYPGADDNASGVAMLLEVAEHFALRKEKPARTVMFVAFDQEETGLQGSTHFATHPPLPFRRLKAFLTADLIGRSMANLMGEQVYVLGSERSPQLRKLVEEVKPPEGLTVGRLGADLLSVGAVAARSDYGPFRDRSVPFLFFSTGQHPDYHQPTDTPDRIEYPKLLRISLLIGEITARLANDATAPVWDAKGLSPDLDEVRTIHSLVRKTLDAGRRFPLTAEQRETMEGVEKRLSEILKRGKVTGEERSWLVSTARTLLLSVY